MAGERSGLTLEGSLYEAVARGNKDSFFFSEEAENAVNPFETAYRKIPPNISELRRIPPLNGSDFGRSCEFDMEIAGDLFVAPTLLIDLPSWLPPVEAALNIRGIAPSDASGVTYGYINGIAYFLFSKIQIYQDKILLDEFSGDALYMARAARGSLNSAYLENTLTGVHDGSAAAIAAAATPGRLRVELPFLGSGTRGFPSIAMRAQNFKIRLTLRKLEELVESSDAAATVAPAPWALESLTVPAIGTAESYTFTPLSRSQIDSPTIQLETRHIYVDGETQLALQEARLEAPFSRLFENTFTFGPTDYSPLDRAAVAAVTRRLDARFPASRLLWGFRSYNDLRANRRWKFYADNGTGEYYNNMSLIIAGRDRETLFSPSVWSDLTHHAKEDRAPFKGVAEMNWDLGAILGRRAPFERQPEGSVNFGTADRPTLFAELAAVPADLILKKPSVEFTAIVDSWALYEIEKNRGYLKYGN